MHSAGQRNVGFPSLQANGRPCKPSANETRPAAVLKEVPLTEYRLAAGSDVSLDSRISPRYSLLLIPA